MASAPSPLLRPSQPVPDHKLPPAPDSTSAGPSPGSWRHHGVVPAPSRAPTAAPELPTPPSTLHAPHAGECSIEASNPLLPEAPSRPQLDRSLASSCRSRPPSPGHGQLRLPTLPRGVGSSPDPAPAPRLQIKPWRLPFSCSWLHVPERQAHHLSSLPFPLSLSLCRTQRAPKLVTDPHLPLALSHHLLSLPPSV